MYINKHMTGAVLELGRANKESIFKILNKENYETIKHLSFQHSILNTWGNVSFNYYNYICKFSLEHHIFVIIKATKSLSFKTTDWRSSVSSILPTSF